MDLKLLLAIFTGKLIALIIRIFGKTGATAAPGLYALKIDPKLVKKLSKQIQSGSIIISGTNGKTTTARLISTILSKKYNIIHNRSGSNLLRGIASTLIANADDPGISFLTKSFKGKTIFFGISDKQINLPKTANVADIRHCLNCQSNLKYTAILSAHMGHYSCPNCTFKRPNPNIAASNLIFNSDFSTTANLTIDYSLLTIHYSLPGLYNVYNVLAAFAVAKALKTDLSIPKKAVHEFSAAFGRFQKIKINDKNIIIFLIKNPPRANEVIRIIGQKDKLNLLLILNDNIADGRDVSWIWDTDWELLSSK